MLAGKYVIRDLGDGRYSMQRKAVPLFVLRDPGDIDDHIGKMTDEILLFNADYSLGVIKGLNRRGLKYQVDFLSKCLDEIEERGLTEEWMLYE